MEPDRRCARCQQTKPRSEFSGTYKISSYCKPCMVEYNAERISMLPLGVRQRWVRRIIPEITDDELTHIQNACEYKCQLCGNDVTGRDLHLDHDEERKIIRGWLCRKCNVGIGHLKHDPDLLRRAATYIESANLLADFVARHDEV